MVLCSQLQCKALVWLCLQSRSELQSSLQAPPFSAVPGGVFSNKAAQTFLPHDFPNFSPSCPGDASFVDALLLQIFKSLLHQMGSEPHFAARHRGEVGQARGFLPSNGVLPGSPHPCMGTGGGYSMPGCGGFPRIRWNMGSHQHVPGSDTWLLRSPSGRHGRATALTAMVVSATLSLGKPGEYALVLRKMQLLNPP